MKKKTIVFSTIAIVIVLVITIIVSIWVINSNSSYVKVEQNETGIYIETKKNSMRVEFADIAGIELKETKYGNTQLDGIKWNNCEIGIFENDIQGRYYSFVEKKSSNSLILTLQSTDFACNYIIIGLSSTSELNSLFYYINSKIN